MILAAVLLAAAPSPLPLQRVVVTLPSREVVRFVLYAPPVAGDLAKAIVGQRVSVGAVEIPVATSVRVEGTATQTVTTFEVKLADVPAAVLGVDPATVAARWEGLDAGKRIVAAIDGTLDMDDRNRLEVPTKAFYDAFVRVGDLFATPGSGGVTVHALVSLYNPFSFEVVATSFEYHLAVGSQKVLEGKHPGLRLRPRQSSDVLIEQDVALSDLAGGLGEVLRRRQPTMTGALVIRTPSGDRLVPLGQ
jgi:hypothetical protein